MQMIMVIIIVLIMVIMEIKLNQKYVFYLKNKINFNILNRI